MNATFITGNTGQQRFCPMRENVCFWCTFGRWIQICFQCFSITNIFRSRLKGWNLLRQDTSVFLPWAPWRIQRFLLPGRWCHVLQWCFSIMEVLGYEYNPDQWRLFIDSSKVSLKVVLLHNGNRFPSFLWLLQPTWRKVMEAWSYCWEKLSMTNLSGSCVVISRLWHCYSEYNSRTQNIAVSCASGTAGTRRITM